jgi:LPS sulfotransferase NodH
LKNYVLCSVQRSGKTWIADTLRRLGVGHGLELLTEFERGHAPEQERLTAAQAGGMREFLNCFSEITHRDGFPSVGISIQWSNLHSVLPETMQMLLDIESALTPSILFFLKRRDILGQAISHFLMMESGYAHSTEADDLRERRDLVLYDREKLQDSINHTQGSYAGWEHLFAMTEIQPVTLYYEDFVDNPVVAFGDLAEQISGIRFSTERIVEAVSGLRKISDARDENIRRIYLADS